MDSTKSLVVDELGGLQTVTIALETYYLPIFVIFLFFLLLFNNDWPRNPLITDKAISPQKVERQLVLLIDSLFSSFDQYFLWIYYDIHHKISLLYPNFIY